MKKLTKLFLLTSAALMTACASTPTKHTKDNLSSLATNLIEEMQVPEGFENSDLTLEDARSMAVIRNKNYRQKIDKLLFNLRSKKGNAKSIMPQLYANSFGQWRNNTNASVGVKVDEIGSSMPDDFYTAQDQSYAASKLSLSWNLLDIGLMGHQKALADIDGFEALETTRLGCHQLMVDLERAYWRKAAFEQATSKREWIGSRVDYALSLSNKHIEENPDDRMTELMFQRELIDIKRWYESMYRTLASANSDLARLINIPHGIEFSVSQDASEAHTELTQQLLRPVEELFQTAFENRPELRKAFYNVDRSELESEQAILRHLPGLNLFISANNDTNSFALNQNFLSAGANLSWDVLNLTKMSDTKAKSKLSTALKEQEISVVASAIMAQIMLAKTEVQNLDEEITLAWKAKNIQGQITSSLQKTVAESSGRETHFVKEELLRELSVLREDISRAEYKAAQARLEQSLGEMKRCEAG